MLVRQHPGIIFQCVDVGKINIYDIPVFPAVSPPCGGSLKVATVRVATQPGFL